MKATVTAWARLALLLFGSALATTRLSLLIHEFVGHGLVAVLQGGTITDYRLFAFGGGRISYELPGVGVGGRLAIALGGIVLEIVIGALLLAWSKRWKENSAWRLALSLFGAANLVHGLSYLCFGLHYGYGDGSLLHSLMGSGSRVALTIVAALALVLATFWASKLCSARAVPLAALRRAPIVVVAAAAISAALLHLALTFGAAAMIEDRQYAEIKSSDADRRTAIAIARYQAAARQAQRPPPSRQELEARRLALQEEHAPFPLRLWVLPIAFLALVFGAFQGARRPAPGTRPISGRELILISLAALSATGLIVLCNLLR